jgi:hypothetical protein
MTLDSNDYELKETKQALSSQNIKVDLSYDENPSLGIFGLIGLVLANLYMFKLKMELMTG